MSRRAPKRLLLLALCAFFALLFAGLGIWQVERLRWKLDLIARVEQRVSAAAVAPPGSASWSSLEPEAIEYRRVSLRGTFDHPRETLVEALTEQGPGYWVVTPFRTDAGTYLVNRGFVPPDRRWPGSRAAGQVAGPVTIVGLVRLSEPEGRFLRTNQPEADRWFSRDVAAIATRRGLGPVAPFFIDADRTANPGGFPIGGLTVVSFRNAHLIYALTWFALALLSLFGLALTARSTHNRG
ncbi:SURF1 family protein [Sphingomonas swuensis]|uniref:SURF1-like protein n=1 Tax=Sphingomonas swuensis TaxID=977800 RepID=A0ABP7T5K8_9SPHN